MGASPSSATARLLISCPDGPGIVAAVSAFLFAQGANIVTSDQHSTDPSGGRFFMRMEFTLDLDGEGWAALEREFARVVAEPRAMEWRLARVSGPRRLAVLASREDHCLLDLLWRARRDELEADVVRVISNHPDAAADVASFGVPFAHVPVPLGAKEEAEERLLELVDGCDLVVLARYMQILSGGFLDRLAVPVINIHHSFLPAFVGAEPYRQARERGVKIIGATAHYVTEALDAGPIIEQDVVRVSHRDDVEALARIGRDVERTVLARAVDAHLQDRTIIDGSTTVVF